MDRSFNSRKINHILQGNGPPVIMIHGIAASLYDWTPMLSEVASKGYCAIALDLLGHGDSAKPVDPNEYHIESLYTHFEDWIDELMLETAPVLVGHSLGGYLSLLHTLRNPEKVRGLVLINPFYSPEQLSPILRITSLRPTLGVKALSVVPEWLIHTIMGWDPENSNHFSPEARHQIAADYKRASPNFVHITREISDLTPNLPQVTVPAQVIWGEHDHTLNPKTFPILVEAMPYATSYMVQKCGHQPHIGKPDLINQITVNFLGSLPAVEASLSPRWNASP